MYRFKLFITERKFFKKEEHCYKNTFSLHRIKIIKIKLFLSILLAPLINIATAIKKKKKIYINIYKLL